ncbi:K(lysine) acetyltransferase [Dissophora globulifera]|uniref:histone acetyltransferase n=1 Tax=Dissophora globulifera TaxID=979702 RepID=A0A9P6UXC6_9FUNG|nr:K(lysine) acetyltransferase [Dissophora globulifera]
MIIDRVEVLGKRVIEADTDVYVHYEGTDKRLDEWVDIQRLKPLASQPDDKGSSTEDTDAGSQRDKSQTSSMSSLDPAVDGARSKRKIVKDEATMLIESIKPLSYKRTSETALDNRSASFHGHHGHEHDDEEVPRVRNVEWILYAGYDIATWYYSPFPEEYQDCQRLFICEYCLKYIRQVESFMNHTKNCKRKRPPGVVVYSKGVNKIYKVDGRTNKLYCQNLSLLAKLFLDNKTLYFDVHGFHFFVLTETRSGDRADVPVGFFSKEIVSYDGFNLACILTLPPFQRKSYGKLLIEFSYELTKIEGKVGSPEKPLSDLGKLGYVSYWITAILRELYPRPWPAKRIIFPTPNRRKSKAPSAKSTLADSSSQTREGDEVTPSSSQDETRMRTQDVSSLSTRNADGQVSEPMDLDVGHSHLDANSGTSNGEDIHREIAFSIRELAAKTGIIEEDLLETLVAMGWMTHWQTQSDQITSTTVKNAKRRHRQLMKFHEQQQLLEKFGNGANDSSLGAAGQQDGHESGLGHYTSHSRQASGAHLSTGSSSGNSGSPTLHVSHGVHQGHGQDGRERGEQHQRQLSPHQDQHQQQQSHEMTEQQLSRDIDPIAILEMPDSDGEDGESAVDEQAMLSASGLKDVAVVTLAMVKDYQDRHNIRLDPYLDWDAIDWVAYRSTFE